MSEDGSGLESRVRLQDVADAAGVHVSTASRVLSGSRRVSPENSERVRKAAKRLHYVVNPLGQALRSQTAGTIGFVVPNIENPFFPAVVQAVERSLNARHRSLILCDARDDPVIEAERVKTLISGRVDALLISPVDVQASVATVRMAAQRVVVVQLDRAVDVATDVVRVDQEMGVRLAVGHLRAQACERFAFVTTGQPISTTQARLKAWQHLFQDDPYSREHVLIGEMSSAWGEEAARRILDGPAGLPHAIVCVNDIVAVGLMAALKASGVRVPGDVAVVGFDDTMLASFMTPPLTSVRQPLEMLGTEAVGLVLNRLQPEGRRLKRRQVLLDPELAIRESSLRSRST